MSSKPFDKERIHLLLNIAMERKKNERGELIDKILDRVLDNVLIDSEDKETEHFTKVDLTPKKDTVAKSVVRSSEPEYRFKGDNPIKRGRGRPKKTPDGGTFPPGLESLSLINIFGVDNPRTIKTLEAIAEEGARFGGLPLTRDSRGYRIQEGSDNEKKCYMVNGENFIVNPPNEWSPGSEELYSLWIEFEKVLLVIKEETISIEESNKKENIVSFSHGIKSQNMVWHEASPNSGSSGVPTIHAECARDLLKENKAFLKACGGVEINFAPATFINDDGTWKQSFCQALRLSMVGKLSLGRKDKFALSRLLMTPLGAIEKKLFDIAFPKEYLVSSETGGLVVKRGRGRPRKNP